MTQNEATNRLISQEKLLKAEILELRHQRTTLEDRLTQLSDDFAVMKAKSDSLTTLCRQMELTRDEALEGQARLRSEMKVMQQSVTATFRMETGMAQAMTKGAPSAGLANTANGARCPSPLIIINYHPLYRHHHYHH